MLVVKTFLAPDAHGGTGLFAGEDIPKGKPVWIYHPKWTRFFSVADYFAAPPELRARLSLFAYPYEGIFEGRHLTGVFYDLDDASYTNHSDSANTYGLACADEPCIAVRKIKKGEEITWDYRVCDPENILHNLGVTSCKSFLIERAARQPLSEPAAESAGTLVSAASLAG